MTWGNPFLWVRITQVHKSAVLLAVFLSAHFPYEQPVVRNCSASANRLWVCRITQKLPFAAIVPSSSRRKTETKKFCEAESYLPSEATIHLKSRESIINILCKIFLLKKKKNAPLSSEESLSLRSALLDHEIHPAQIASLKCSPQRKPAPHSNMCPATLTQQTGPPGSAKVMLPEAAFIYKPKSSPFTCCARGYSATVRVLNRIS